MIEAGDITTGNGGGGRSIYGDEDYTFPDENFKMNFTTPGLVSMAHHHDQRNTSQR